MWMTALFFACLLQNKELSALPVSIDDTSEMFHPFFSVKHTKKHK